MPRVGPASQPKSCLDPEEIEAANTGNNRFHTPKVSSYCNRWLRGYRDAMKRKRFRDGYYRSSARHRKIVKGWLGFAAASGTCCFDHNQFAARQHHRHGDRPCRLRGFREPLIWSLSSWSAWRSGLVRQSLGRWSRTLPIYEQPILHVARLLKADHLIGRADDNGR